MGLLVWKHSNSSVHFSAFQVFEKLSGISVAAQKSPPAPIALPPADPNAPKPSVGFIGLGAMGGGMAINLVKKGFHVTGFDVSFVPLVRFDASGLRSDCAPFERAP